MSSLDYTEGEEVRRVFCKRRHVLILGAGASRAALPNGDRNGKIIPLQRDLIQIVGLEPLLKSAGVHGDYEDFEQVYSTITRDPSLAGIRETMDQVIRSYFESLELPDEPTLYDHLVLSLRSKDIIATFNWDPLLLSACARNSEFSDPPAILLLHGSVAAARCESCKILSCKGRPCYLCGESLIELPILFPVTQKDYQTDPAIAGQWSDVRRALKSACALTIFGYSAPKADVEAIRLLKEGWGDPESRRLEEIEIIDVREEDDLSAEWDEFIHTHHYKVKSDFYKSNIAEHPRRSCEALWARLMECKFTLPLTIPRDLQFAELHKWLAPRIEAEGTVRRRRPQA